MGQLYARRVVAKLQGILMNETFHSETNEPVIDKVPRELRHLLRVSLLLPLVLAAGTLLRIVHDVFNLIHYTLQSQRNLM